VHGASEAHLRRSARRIDVLATKTPLKRKGLRATKAEQRSALRETILRTARRIIRKQGFDGLSMRKLAQELDCSPMTLYSFFRDKHALLVVLAQEIFEDLSRGVGGDDAADPFVALREGCRRYVRFGLENPDEYRIIFMTPGGVGDGTVVSPQTLLKYNRAFAIKVERVQACIDHGVIRGDAFAAATLLWTSLHGVVSILIACPTFPFGNVENYIEETIDFALRALTSEIILPLQFKNSTPGA
jgi:AcrR family transcriptional regulator